MISPFREILITLILLFGAVWLFTTPGTKPAKKKETLLSSIFHNTLLMFGFTMPFLKQFHAEALGWRFLPPVLVVEWSGVFIAAFGFGFAIWARFILGSNWSSAVVIKEGQHLIQHGPYAIVRNPIYTGIIFFMFGAALTVGELRGLAGLGLVVISFWHKAKTEERFLSEEFGEEYLAYQKRTKFIVPFII